jgi:hypothetical protein
LENYSSSVLDEIKTLAARDAENESNAQSSSLSGNQQASHFSGGSSSTSPSSKPAPRHSVIGSLSQELSDTLSDIHRTISADAKAEEERRASTIRMRREEEVLKRETEEAQKLEEVQIRISAERARQEAVADERHLKQIRLQYEAALERGEDVELPVELREPEPISPQVFEPEVAVINPVIEEELKRNQSVFIGGGIVALIAVVTAALVFFDKPPAPPKTEPIQTVTAAEPLINQADLEAEQTKVMLAEQEAKQKAEREAAEAKRQAELAAAKAKAKAKRTRKKRRTGKKKKKGGLKLDLSSF